MFYNSKGKGRKNHVALLFLATSNSVRKTGHMANVMVILTNYILNVEMYTLNFDFLSWDKDNQRGGIIKAMFKEHIRSKEQFDNLVSLN